SLFKRGRYFRPSTPGVLVRGSSHRASGNRKEGERFAAAAIAFAWKHDHEARRRFWEQVCHFPGDPPLSPSAQILVEPEHWADLLIINPTTRGRFVYAVECKIDAKLDDIQNPRSPAFSKPDGYGAKLVASDTRESKFRYVVF